MPLYEFEKIPEKEIVPGYFGKFVHTDNNTFALWRVEGGAVMPEHSHPHEQCAMVLEGEFELTIEGKTVQLSPGKMITIPGDVPHSGLAITDCRILDTFHPAREEYR
jgi:quercetin dioxygenase-like cupin family protein